jgi:hypothetical protein
VSFVIFVLFLEVRFGPFCNLPGYLQKFLIPLSNFQSSYSLIHLFHILYLVTPTSALFVHCSLFSFTADELMCHRTSFVRILWSLNNSTSENVCFSASCLEGYLLRAILTKLLSWNFGYFLGGDWFFCFVLVVFRFEFKALHLLGRRSITWATPSALHWAFWRHYR